MKKLLFLTTILNTLLFASFDGTIIDKDTLKPISKAIISDSKKSIYSDENGFFSILSDEKKYHAKAYGYRPLSFSQEQNQSIIELESIKIKALYLTFWGANIHSKTVARALKIIDKTEVNTLVVDVKNEYGSTSFRTTFAKANDYGASKDRTIGNIEDFIKLMKSRNIYLIARVVVFKDELQASNNEEYAIKDEDGSIWRNHDKMAWVDPFDKRSHDYTISIAEEAAKVGFDEINFDYIRFPAKANLKLKKESTEENRLKAIETFLSSAQDRLRKYGVFISVDTYGNICWESGDNGIGQSVASLAKHSDYISPMLYPSGFASGSFYFEHPSEHPYEVIRRSIINIHDTIDPNRIRPWLQYFKDYAHKKRSYNKFEVTEQIRASDDTNTSGWMFWSPSSRYHKCYFKASIE
ncbi:GTP-binding protein [Sulfurimonas hongkongensis]|uniref:GTP-binding protein n=1 Tax=Sulfurimonas hongkongensis TaxID=1172190 RepID=T0JTM6_9BACT|nr:putative glycoside hydrolase [Sulfurimonas hongkongensis]EQB40317.1 GTP-binding protein [Sulfurimonas hongkongensis]